MTNRPGPASDDRLTRLREVLAGGELHYWRVDPDAWPRLIEGARSMGLPSISSYVQWEFHQVGPATYDFDGRTSPRRDLLGYLELVARSDLALVIRPGPYTFAEWRNYGVPDDMVDHHRLSEAFLEEAGRWIDAVSAVLRPFLSSNGGPIVMLQADNMFDLGQNRYDRSLGLLGGPGIFQGFLRETYGTIDALNATWQASATDFDELVAMTEETGAHEVSHPRYLDYTRFRSWYAERAVRWTVDRYRAAGIDVPIYTNPIADQDMRRTAALVDLIGLNHYPTHGYGLPDEHQRLLDHVRLGTALSPVPYVAELESGIWHGYHYTKGIPDPDDYQAMFATILAGGARNWSWYMLHDRDNWYMAPFNEKGEPRTEVVEVFSRCVNAWREGRAWEWQPRVRTGVVWSPGASAASGCALLGGRSSRLRRALHDAGLDLAFVLPGDGPVDGLAFLDDGAWLPEDDARQVLAWVEAGGQLVVLADTAFYDETMQRARVLDIASPDGSLSQGYMDTFRKDVDVLLPDSPVTVQLPTVAGIYRDPPGEPINAITRAPDRILSDNVLGEYERLVRLGTGETFSVGYRQRRGDGSITVLAVQPTASLLVAIHRSAGIEIPAAPRSPATMATLYERGDDRIVVVLNRSDEPQITAVDLSPEAAPRGPRINVRDLLNRPERSDAWYDPGRRRLHASVGRRSGTVVELSTSDVASR